LYPPTNRPLLLNMWKSVKIGNLLSIDVLKLVVKYDSIVNLYELIPLSILITVIEQKPD
jgi:hypothetical protein